MSGKVFVQDRRQIQLDKIQWDKIQMITERFLFPLILLLFPLLKMNQGVDLTDTGYSLGNYRFFASMDGTWTVATFFSNVTGYLFTLLPLGNTMLGMKFYSSLLISFMALFAYRFFSTKMPKALAFAGEMAAIGLCWCPTVILYNYMTYVFLLTAVVLLFRGLAGERPRCLLLAGICLGLNVFVRFSNAPQAALILAVWYYGMIRKKTFRQVLRETLICLAGYLAALAVMLITVMLMYGPGAYLEMIFGLFSMTEEASDYTMGGMLYAIWDAYRHGMKWLLYLAVCVLPGIPFFLIRKNQFAVIKKVVYCMCIAFLVFVLGRWGMYNFKYYQKEAALQWAVVFLLVSVAMLVFTMCSRRVNWDWKLIACIAFLVILITPLGSNNHVWPIINNLFFVAPVTFWLAYRFIRWGREYGRDYMANIPLFPVKSMLAAVMIMFLIQSIGVGCAYVFLDGETGEKRTAKITENTVLDGMYTTPENAAALEEISLFMKQEQQAAADQAVILYGNIPALSYYLDIPAAIFTSWPDLDSNTYGRLQADLADLSREIRADEKECPTVVIAADYMAQQADHQEAGANKKYRSILAFMAEFEYQEAFANDTFIVFQAER